MSKHIYSIDTFKVFAMLCIVCIHTHPFYSYPDFEVLGVFINKFVRFAVPFFFMCSGYFLGNKLQNTQQCDYFKVTRKSTVRLLTLFLSWGIIYGTITGIVKGFSLNGVYEHIINSPLNFVFEGGTQILWFLTALIIGQWIVTIFLSIGKGALLLILATGLYIFGLIFGGAYHFVFFDFDTGLNTRNGPFLSTLCITLGVIASMMQTPTIKRALWLVIAGFTLQTIEYSFIATYYPNMFWVSYVVGTVPYAFGVFLLALAVPNFGKEWGMLPKIGSLSLGVYLIHQIFNKGSAVIGIDISHVAWEAGYPFIIYSLSILATMVLIKIPYTKRLVT